MSMSMSMSMSKSRSKSKSMFSSKLMSLSIYKTREKGGKSLYSCYYSHMLTDLVLL